MILKILDHRKGKQDNHYFEEWTYFDNIQSASAYYDENCKEAVVRCAFKDGNDITFTITDVAYLMSDTGKTVDRLTAAVKDTEQDAFPTLMDAAVDAMGD